MNKQITEDYCSFEIAQLLKEKGFDEPCSQTYAQHPAYEEPIVMINDASTNSKGVFGAVFPCYASAPTHQMALKWLREVHNIYINILTYTTGKNIQFRWVGYDNGRLFSQEEGRTIYFESYEQAVETALLYVLKNLI